MQLVQEKYEAGETAQVSQPEPEEKETGSARIYDLTEMLQRSLKGRKQDGKRADSQAQPADTKDDADNSKASAGKKTAAKTAAKKAGKSASAKKSGATAKTTAAKTTRPSNTAKTTKTAAKTGAAAKKSTKTTSRKTADKTAA